jgi:hypothetical protein
MNLIATPLVNIGPDVIGGPKRSKARVYEKLMDFSNIDTALAALQDELLGFHWKREISQEKCSGTSAIYERKLKIVPIVNNQSDWFHETHKNQLFPTYYLSMSNHLFRFFKYKLVTAGLPANKPYSRQCRGSNKRVSSGLSRTTGQKHPTSFRKSSWTVKKKKRRTHHPLNKLERKLFCC